MNLKIRPMDELDLEEVYTIEGSVHITPWSKKIVKDCILVGYDCRVLEGENKTIVGYIISRYNNYGYHILNFCIAKPMQAQGLGKLFLQTMLDSLAQDPMIDYILLEVRPSNKAALHLYTGMGFQHVERKENYYKDVDKKEDAIVLMLPTSLLKKPHIPL